MECMIEIENLSLTMKKQVILSDINLTFEKGKIHGLIGRNGSGKTMLMKCILGFIRPSQGTIWVDHKRIGKEVDFPPHTGVIIETPGFIPHYSGMRQRLGIAQAIMEEPNLLVLDEPFNGLDAEGVLQMRKLLLGKKALGTTILLSSHNAEDIETLCDTVSKMEQGKVLRNA